MNNTKKSFIKAKLVEKFLELTAKGNVIGKNPFNQLRDWSSFYLVEKETYLETQTTLAQLLSKNYDFKYNRKCIWTFQVESQVYFISLEKNKQISLKCADASKEEAFEFLKTLIEMLNLKKIQGWSPSEEKIPSKIAA